jgi:hypothetical protein
LAFFIKRACAVAPGLAQTRRGYCPVSQGSAHIRQASLGPACVAPAFPLAPPVERAVRSHDPRAWAIGRAQPRWRYHPRCARCFAPFTTAGSIRASTLQIVEVRPAQVRKHLHALARPYPASVAFRVKSASEYPQLPVQGGRKQGRRAQAAPSGLPARRGRAARSHFEARQGRPRPRLARPVVSRAHSVVVAQLIQWPTAFCLSAFCRLCTRCTDRLLQLAQIEAPPHSLHTCVSAVVPHAANFLGESVLLRAVTAVPIPSRARPSACVHYAATGRLDGASSGDSS